jgi:tetratricopeptide (TPR) repeat protein
MEVFLSYFPYNESRYLRAVNLLSQNGTLRQGYPLLQNSLQSLRNTNARNKALASYYKFGQQYDSALYYLRQARKLSPKDNLVLLDLGFIHLAQQNYAEAEVLFSEVIQNSPDNQEAYHQRSVARFELKNYAGTIDDISTSISLKEKPDTLSYIIRGFAQFGINNRQSACDDWKLAAELGSRQGRILLQNYCKN